MSHSSSLKAILDALKVKLNSKTVKMMKRPRQPKGINRPTMTVPEPNQVVKMDLLSLPTDRGYKYLLTAIDMNTKYADAEPLKSKTQDEVLEAAITLFSRGNVNQPETRLEIDGGTEFNSLSKYLKNQGVKVKRGKPYRHRQ